MTLQIRSIDTMKLSRDNNTRSLSQIQALVNQYRGLNLTHLTCDVWLSGNYQSDTFKSNWVTAIRNIGVKIWWRPGWSALSDDLETRKEQIKAPIVAHPEWFENGDIFDMIPEQSMWSDVFGDTEQAKRANWNAWVREMKTELDSAFNGINKQVECGITSITDWNLLNTVEQETADVLGYMCIDHYPTGALKDPIRAAKNVMSDLRRVYAKYGKPVVIGEFGHSRNYDAEPESQREVLRLIFNEISKHNWIVGFNYWCGHGGAGYGDFCNLFESISGQWKARPALKTLSEFYTKGACTGRMEVI